MKISPKMMVVVAFVIGVVAVVAVFGRLGDNPDPDSESRTGKGKVTSSGARPSGSHVGGKSGGRGGSSPGGAGGEERASKSPRDRKGEPVSAMRLSAKHQ